MLRKVQKQAKEERKQQKRLNNFKKLALFLLCTYWKSFISNVGNACEKYQNISSCNEHYQLNWCSYASSCCY
ncbi:hypothetical protein EA686_25190 [Acinetobacter baumannii]|uniref:Uncharacterized protein n=1 Tax=Acinetobacter baumannii TaxID=470 RepID=A0A429MIU3_ACIBA|nr:hypothetical protein EA686_25190 [Acinetobacter baumannii]